MAARNADFGGQVVLKDTQILSLNPNGKNRSSLKR